MRTFVPLASLAFVVLAAACSGFTEIGEGTGKAGMAGSAGSGVGGASGKAGKGGSGGSQSGMTGGTGGSSTGGTMSEAGSGGSDPGTGGTGGGASGGTGGSGYEPCADKPCGATCNLCPPNDATCGETAVVKYCDSSGTCGSTFPLCEPAGECKTIADCPVTDVGCAPCADGSYACPTVNCVDGKCVSTFPTCPSPECDEDTDCPSSKAPCQVCADGNTACPWAKCDGGKCVAGIDTCSNEDPCAGKACGDYCTTCNPNTDLACIAVVMFCDESLKCQSNQPLCSNEGCKSDDECVTDACGLCPGTDRCAGQVCVEGKCTFECPPDPCGGCNTPDEICIYQLGGPGPSHYTCAKQNACNSPSPCACIVDQGVCKPEMVDGFCQCENDLQ